MSGQPRAVGVLAGNGRFPFLFARGARKAGLRVVAVGIVGEADPALAGEVDALEWSRIARLGDIISAFKRHGVEEAAFAGGVRKLVALRAGRPDWVMLSALATLRSLNDDALLRALAGAFEARGVKVVASTKYMAEVLAPAGQLGSEKLSASEEKDVALGREVAQAIGRADVGQTVVVHRGSVVAVEAAEGTDACIRRAGELAGPGIVVVKRCKPGQDVRFDLPAVGPNTVASIAAVKGRALCIEAGKTVVLEAPELVRRADEARIAVVAG